MTKQSFKLKEANKEILGKKAVDNITGFKGVIIGISHWLTGCDQVIIKPSVDKMGNLRDSQAFDIGQINIFEEIIKKEKITSKKPGGPNPDGNKLAKSK
jgi:hypothetical protein